MEIGIFNSLCQCGKKQFYFSFKWSMRPWEVINSMITSTSSSALSSLNYGQLSIATQAQSNSASQSPTSLTSSDSVQLSDTAQVAAMNQQGMSVKFIASNMGLTTAEVDSYLGITASSGGASTPVKGGGPPAAPSQAASASKAPAVKTSSPVKATPTG
jgi:hypothetical protein